MKIISLFPFAYLAKLPSNINGNANFLRIVVDPSSPNADITYAHELHHVHYCYRHPIKICTAKGKEESEEISHCVNGIMAERQGVASFEEQLDWQAHVSIRHGGYKRKGMWPDAYGARPATGETRDPEVNWAGAEMLKAKFRSRRPRAEAWLDHNARHIERVAAKILKERGR